MDTINQINYDNLGAIEREPTLSDFDLGAFTPSDYPDTFTPEYPIVVEAQGKTPACGAHVGAYLKDFFILEQTGNENRRSPAYLWKKIKQIDTFLPEEGTTMIYIMKALKNSGICSYELAGNDVTLPLTEYTSPASITPQMDADARNNTIDSYAFTFNPTMDQLKSAIYHHKYVVMALRVGNEWWTKTDGTPSWSESDIMPLRDNAPISSGHFVVAIGYDKDYIYFLNEWSDQWARGGIGYFGQDYLHRCVEIGTAVDHKKYVFNKLLRYGMKNSDVAVLQKTLSIPIDGIFGPQTLKAVQDFQTKHGLIADGIVGPLTNSALNNI